MCIKACSGIEKMRDEISILVVATSTNRKYFPSVAAYLHGALGLNRSVVAFDVNDACNGFIQALQIARSLILNTGKSALVVGADEMSRFLDWKDRSTCVLFGDAAGSIIIRDNPKKVYKQTNYTLSQYNDLFQINPNFKMEGKTVFKMAVESMIEDAKDIIKDIDINRIKYFIPHQANERITKLVNESLAMNTVNNIKYTGNTNAATIPLALNSIYENLKPGDFALMTAFGAGLRGGSVLIEM